MTGILKVDQWKDSGDNALMTSDGAGNLTANAGIVIPSGATITNNGTASGFPGLGKIGQVIHASTVTQVTDTAASHIDTGLSATITPTSTSSKILIHITQAFGKNSNNTQVDANLQRDSTVIVSEWLNDDIRTGDATTLFPGHSALCWLDSPSTTSAVTYKTTFRNAAASGTVYAQGNNSRSSIILMEVLA